MTSGRRRSPIAACPLPIALLRARFLQVAPPPLARQLPIPHPTARLTAHALRLHRRARRREPLTTLGASAAHPRSVPVCRGSSLVDHDPAAPAALIMRRGGSRSRRGVDLYKAAAEDRLQPLEADLPDQAPRVGVPRRLRAPSRQQQRHDWLARQASIRLSRHRARRRRPQAGQRCCLGGLLRPSPPRHLERHAARPGNHPHTRAMTSPQRGEMSGMLPV